MWDIVFLVLPNPMFIPSNSKSLHRGEGEKDAINPICSGGRATVTFSLLYSANMPVHDTVHANLEAPDRHRENAFGLERASRLHACASEFNQYHLPNDNVKGTQRFGEEPCLCDTQESKLY